MQKFLLYDTDEGLDFAISCVPIDRPWVSCRVFRVYNKDETYFETIKSEEYLVTHMLKEDSIGTFSFFEHAIEAADLVARTHRIRNHWPEMRRMG